MNIDITDVKVFKIEKRGALLGYANVVINDSFIIKGIRILEKGKKGRFLAMPYRKNKNNKYIDLCHPINQETRDLITLAVLDVYNVLEKADE